MKNFTFEGGKGEGGGGRELSLNLSETGLINLVIMFNIIRNSSTVRINLITKTN